MGMVPKEPVMNKSVSLVILAGGVLLVVYGVIATQSLSSDFSNLFTGSPTDKSMWMLLGGAVISVIGLAGLGSASSRPGT